MNRICGAEPEVVGATKRCLYSGAEQTLQQDRTPFPRQVQGHRHSKGHAQTRVKAEKEYRQFVEEGIGRESVWNEVKGQTLLGEDDFVNGLADHLKAHKDIHELPKSQRYANRPTREKIFNKSVLDEKRKRDKKIAEAVEKYGYTQRAIADYLGVHFTYVSRLLRDRGER